MAHTARDKKRLLSRVRRIRGQVEALERALESDTQCAAVLQQIAAVRGAVNGLMGEVLEGHVREHLVPVGARSRQYTIDLDQIIGILRTYVK